ncbi:hypothetical protein [Deinococcus aquiradiocola]|uniref:VRR-NUC domain-containing protein n=1 Tax=Deinococcus aquiradiocola TaxID=393059 RepID=A0A917P786_9DEIO|nr:hypothetical protein [Deinococcus aquiradiocola]GGJ65195.1 hypothetical protein GCM10008939_06370 [Deinococcus aquiradiocola]
MTLPHASEAMIEAAVCDLFTRAGWYALKTDAAQVTRGARHARPARGTIDVGFPDRVFLLSLPGSPLCLAALVELKTATGRVRASQVARHAELRDRYGLKPQIVRDARQAEHLIHEGLRLRRLLKGQR